MKYFSIRKVAALLLSVAAFHAYAQEQRQVIPQPLQDAIQVDGLLEEQVWKQAALATDFWQQYPTDTVRAPYRTEVWLAYDEAHLYVAAKLYGAEQRPVVQSLKRDADFWNSDGFALLLDPLYKRVGGYVFGVNAGGAQFEGLVNETNGQADESWDTKWFSEVRAQEGFLAIEMAIPLRVMRYNQGNKEWGINFIRNNLSTNSFSAWNRVPQQYPLTSPNYAGTLQWPQAPGKGRNIVLLPYLKGGVAKNHQQQTNTRYEADAGADLKMRIGTSLNLDLTVNPDFSQVEVDQQVTNLDRFDPTFPERRGFFLENSDIFNGFGTWPGQPFNSRSIGIRKGQAIPILFGAKLSGNLSEDLRVGLLSVQTKAHEEFAAQNYTVAAVRRRLFGRTNISGLITNRQGFNNGTELRKNDFNRNYGAEFNYQSEDGKWVGLAQFHQSVLSEKVDDRHYYSFSLQHYGRNFQSVTYWSRIGTNYTPDAGLTPRTEVYDPLEKQTHRIGFYQLWSSQAYNIYPKNNSVFIRHRFELRPTFFYDLGNMKLNDATLGLNYTANLANRARIEANSRHVDVVLPYAFWLPGAKEPLPATRYNFTSGRLAYFSDPRRPFSWSIAAESGEFYNGHKNSFVGGIKYRVQPWGNFSVDVTQHYIKLPEGFGSSEITLVSPRAEFAFSRNLFWTTFLQYNTQATNFNINSRVQWRFRPMSDLYLVYTDNYATDHLKVRNRGIVLKLNYWLNV